MKDQIPDLQMMQETVLNMFFQLGIKETKRIFRDSMIFLIIEYHETKEGFILIDKQHPNNKVTFKLKSMKKKK